MAVNVGGTTSVLEACVRSGVSRVVFASSSSVYGECGDERLSEEDSRLEPVSPYGVSKYAGESVAEMYARLHGIRVAALRFFSVYGPRQRPDQAIFKFLVKVLTGEPVECFGDGSTARDYTHVSDVVAGTVSALDWLSRESSDFQVFNIGSGRSVLLRDLMGMIGMSVGKTPVVLEVPRPTVDVSRTCASIDKARAVLGYSPRVMIEEGLAQFKEWYEVTYGHQRSSVA
jgi:UDP-glucuronate 4-epimerase